MLRLWLTPQLLYTNNVHTLQKGMSFDDEFDSPSQEAFWATAVRELKDDNKQTKQQRQNYKTKYYCNEAVDVAEEAPPSQEVTWNEKRKYHFQTNAPDDKQSLSFSDDDGKDGAMKFNSGPVKGPTTPAPQLGDDQCRQKKRHRRRRLTSIDDDEIGASQFIDDFIGRESGNAKGTVATELEVGPNMEVAQPRVNSYRLTTILNPPVDLQTNAYLFSKNDIEKKRKRAVERRNLKVLEKSDKKTTNEKNVTVVKKSESKQENLARVSKSNASAKVPSWFFDDFE